MFGSHLSIAGGMHKAAEEAARLGFDTVQVFTRNQAQWRAPELKPEATARWRDAVREARLAATIAHDSYLINLASPEAALRERSIAAFTEELRRCDQLGIGWLVTHPGAHMGAGEEAGLARVAAALDEVHARLPTCATVTCLEITAGQGTCLGHRLEHLAWIIEHVAQPGRLAVCLDTAHLLAAGYDFRGRKYPAFQRELDRVLGLERVRVWHLNDSKTDLGSRVDRHEHIGHGFVGLEGFRPILRDRAWGSIPKILETPKARHESGCQWDEVNLRALRELLP